MDSYHWTGPDDRNLDPVRDKPVRLREQRPERLCIVCAGCDAVGDYPSLAAAREDGWLVIDSRMYCTVCQAYGRPLRKTP